MIPNKKDRVIVNDIIFEELCMGKTTDQSREEFVRIIKELKVQGAEGIILGCTEIGMLVKSEDANVPLFDTTVIHAAGAVDYALGT